MNELSSVIKSAREMAGLTIREAEIKSGISNAYLSQIENGKIKNPSPQILCKLSMIYDLPFDILMGKAGFPLPDYTLRYTLEKREAASVLIVDDCREDRELLSSYLSSGEKFRYRIIETESGEGAFEVISSESPDCIILDYKLPDMTGLELLKIISGSEKTCLIPVIIMTGYGSEDVAVSAMKLGAINFMIKGEFKKEDLIRSVDDAITLKIIRDLIKSEKKLCISADPCTGIIPGKIDKINKRIDVLCNSEAGAVLAPELRLLQVEIAELSKCMKI